jgi:hypothetical protein
MTDKNEYLEAFYEEDFDYEDYEPRVLALAQFLEVHPEELELDGYHTITVSPGKTKRGASPKEIQERADLLYEALIETGHIVKNCASLSVFRYDETIKLFNANPKTAEMMKVGIHDLANTLYWLLRDNASERQVMRDNASERQVMQDYVSSLREAFDGQEVVDRREWVSCSAGEYLVVTDDEAEELWDQYLESYIDECILPEASGMAKDYFDREGWKEDARHDGRGHSLASYDGNEDEVVEEIYGETFYIYRTN